MLHPFQTDASYEKAHAPALRNRQLHQWFTPAWAAEEIIAQEFGWLEAGHRVIEPSCGDGAFLCAVPGDIEALGVEIDPEQADQARRNSGRPVITGDFLLLSDDELGSAHAVFGNPPFESELVARFLNKSVGLLHEGGQVGFILPAYILQTSSKVELLSRQFSIHQQLLPRNLFPGLKLPLVFARFVKEKHRRLYGFLLYREAQDMADLNKACKSSACDSRGRRGAWFEAVQATLATLGGEADLQRIYEAMAKRRPSGTQFWREKVRQILQRSADFQRTGPGRYALCA